MQLYSKKSPRSKFWPWPRSLLALTKLVSHDGFSWSNATHGLLRSRGFPMHYILLLLTLASGYAGRTSLDRQSALDNWQDEKACAINSLTWCMYLMNISAPRDEVRDLFPLRNESGYSLTDISDTASKWYLFPAVYRVNVEGLLHLRLPLIAHVSLGRQEEGHYIVIHGISNNGDGFRFQIVDGSTGSRLEFSQSKFDKLFTGYVVTFNPWPIRTLRTVSITVVALNVVHIILLLLMHLVSARGFGVAFASFHGDGRSLPSCARELMRGSPSYYHRPFPLPSLGWFFA